MSEGGVPLKACLLTYTVVTAASWTLALYTYVPLVVLVSVIGTLMASITYPSFGDLSVDRFYSAFAHYWAECTCSQK